MKKSAILMFILCSSVFLHSQAVGTISDLTLEEFYNVAAENPALTDSLYLWNGVISEINEKETGLEVVVLKAEWLSLKEIRAFKVILKIENENMKNIVKKIGTFKRISFLTSVSSFSDGIPVCSPIKLYEF